MKKSFGALVLMTSILSGTACAAPSQPEQTVSSPVADHHLLPGEVNISALFPHEAGKTKWSNIQGGAVDFSNESGFDGVGLDNWQAISTSALRQIAGDSSGPERHVTIGFDVTQKGVNGDVIRNTIRDIKLTMGGNGAASAEDDYMEFLHQRGYLASVNKIKTKTGYTTTLNAHGETSGLIAAIRPYGDSKDGKIAMVLELLNISFTTLKSGDDLSAQVPKITTSYGVAKEINLNTAKIGDTFSPCPDVTFKLIQRDFH